MNIAIFSPSQNPYSETFIQAHKNHLKGKVFYYYGVAGMIKLEGSDRLISKIYNYKLRIQRFLFGLTYQWINEKALLKSLQINKVQVILVEYGNHAFSLDTLLSANKLPFVVHFHGYDASVNQVIKNCNNYKTVFEKATKIIAVSTVMETKLLDLGCPHYKLEYNVYGPSNDFLRIQPKFNKSQFVAVGRFTDKKAPYLSILAFNQVLPKYTDANLIIAGDGVLLNTCKNLVKHLNIEHAVKFVGVITPQQFQSYLVESLAFVQHSITADNGDMEGTPVVILEASAAGLPVISTYHGGIPDVIIHDKTGLLCKEHDVNSMAKHLCMLLEDVNYASKLGTAGKIHIATNFSMERHLNALQQVLKTAAK